MMLLVRILGLLVLGYAVLCAFVYLNQRNMMFFPATERVPPAGTGLAGVREVEFVTHDGEPLYSWYRQAVEGQPTILFFHGNGGSVAWRSYRFSATSDTGFGMFMLGYPGYGGSGGSPSEAALHEAGRFAYDWLLEAGVAARDIVIYGESIGSGVGVQLAARVEAAALVLEAPMSSAADVAAEHYSFLPVRYLLRDTFESTKHVSRADMPLLIIHGDADTIIPIKYGEKLFDAANEPKQFVRLQGAGHNNLDRFDAQKIAVQFIRGLRQQEESDVSDI